MVGLPDRRRSPRLQSHPRPVSEEAQLHRTRTARAVPLRHPGRIDRSCPDTDDGGSTDYDRTSGRHGNNRCQNPIDDHCHGCDNRAGSGIDREKGANVTFVAVGIKGKLYGSYRQTGRDASGALWGAFTEAGEKQQVWWETGRTEWTVALIDERGAVQLLIDLYRNKVEAAQPGKAREFLYDILSANGVPVTTTVPTTAPAPVIEPVASTLPPAPPTTLPITVVGGPPVNGLNATYVIVRPLASTGKTSKTFYMQFRQTAAGWMQTKAFDYTGSRLILDGSGTVFGDETGMREFRRTKSEIWLVGKADKNHQVRINFDRKLVLYLPGPKSVFTPVFEIVQALVDQAPPPPLVVKFSPILWFDRGANKSGFPMYVQPYRDILDLTVPGGMTDGKLDGRLGGWKAGVTGPFENSDPASIKSGLLPTYYQYREVGPIKQVRITFWWFYGYQHRCNVTDIGPTGTHPGDWERVMVILNDKRTAVAAVTYWQHNGKYTRIAGPPDAPSTPAGVGRSKGTPGFRSETTHVMVWVEKNSHGSYHEENSAGPGGCSYWDGFRNPDGVANRMDTSANLVSLDVGTAEPWMADDRKGGWTWGVDAISTHPTTDPPTEGMFACEGNSLYTAQSSGCFKSEALSGDDQLAGDAFKECEPGYVNHGLTCYKSVVPPDWYGRATGSRTYGYAYVLPTTEAGLSRRRITAGEWAYPVG